MTEYIIDIVVENIWHSTSCRNQETTFYIKIDTNGNVNIKRQINYLQCGHPNTIGLVRNMVTINDNIPIPSYLIDMIKNTFCEPTSSCELLGSSDCGDLLFLHHYLNAIENIIILKRSLSKVPEKLIDLL